MDLFIYKVEHLLFVISLGNVYSQDKWIQVESLWLAPFYGLLRDSQKTISQKSVRGILRSGVTTLGDLKC